MVNQLQFTTSAVLAILAGCLFGCKGRAPTAGADSSPVVAEVGGERITLRELDASISADLYRLRAESLHQIVALRTERLAATKRGVAVKDYRAERVDALVPEPTDEQLNAALDKAKLAGTVPPDTQLAGVRKELSNFLSMGPRRVAKEEYIDQLYLDFGVRMNLDALGRPRVPFRLDGPSRGPDDASVVIVEYTDLTSEYGAMGNKTMREVLEKYPNDVRLVCKHKPDAKDETGARAAEAALCAHDQKKYWEYRQVLFDNPGRLAPESLKEFATKLGLTHEAFTRCVDERKYKTQVESDVDEARRYGLVGTPAVALNGTPLSGAHTFRMYRRLIEIELAPKKKTALGEPGKSHRPG